MKKLLFVVLILVSTVAYSQVEKGDVSLTFNVSFTSTNGSGIGSINAKLGRFFTQNVEVGVRPQILIGDGFTTYGTGAYGTYNFLTTDGKILPYIGVDLSVMQTETDLLGFTVINAGGYGGAKYFITEAINVDAGIIYSSQIAGDELGGSASTFMMNIGIGFIFGKLK